MGYLAGAKMRGANLFFCLFLACFFASAPLLATDLKGPRQSYPHNGPPPRGELTAREVAQFCFTQRVICRKICDLHSRFDRPFDGCPQSCESRELRCNSTACFRWTDPDFLIAERFGGYRCADL